MKYMKMKISVLIVVFCAIFLVECQSQMFSVELLSGSSFTTAPVYPSSYGVFTAGAKPPRTFGCRSVMYGNYVYTILGSLPSKCDVWAFDPTSKKWAWMSGNSVDSGGSRGIRGIASSSNLPRHRYYFAGDLNSARGEYVVYGGRGGAEVNHGDLWTFNFTSNMWTWVAGKSIINESPIYSALGSATSTAYPGARAAATGIVYPPTGEFLLFGGDNELASSPDFYADVWAYDFDADMWTWISGTSSLYQTVSPTNGQWSTLIYPSHRSFAEIVFVPETSIAYIYGGGSYLGDLWAFKRDTLEWALLKKESPNRNGRYGNLGQSANSNVPGGRRSPALEYIPALQLIFMFGGDGLDQTGNVGLLSDTWVYSLALKEWTWVSGSSYLNEAGNFTVGYQTPGGQGYSGITQISLTGAFYVFGGYGYISPTVQRQTDFMWLMRLFYPAPPPPLVSSRVQSITSAASTRRLHSSTVPVLSSSRSPLVSRVSSKTSVFLRSSSKSQIQSQQQLPLLVTATKRSTDSKTINPESSFHQLLTNNPWRSKILLYLILGATAVISIAVTSILYFITYRKKVSRLSRSSKALATTQSSAAPPSGASTTISGLTTLAGTDMGAYLPGGLFIISEDSYRAEKEIAKGGGGSIWLATAFDELLLEYGPRVIVKIPKIETGNQRALDLFHQEIALLNAFKSSSRVVILLGYTESPCSIVLKYYPHGSLSAWITSGCRTYRIIQSFITDISLAVATLHNNGVAHCDLKPDNVLIDESEATLKAVLSDFGISRIVSDKLLKVAGFHVQLVKGASIAYASPEALVEYRTKRSVTNETEIMARDIYALGLILYNMMEGRLHWH